MSFSPEHPALPGHFPGHPIVPGALLLAKVIAAFERAQKDKRVTGFARVKFRAPLRPGVEAQIVFSDPRAHRCTFEVRAAGAVIVAGTLTYGGGE